MPSVLLPREHGAYGQAAFPLVTGLVLAGGAPRAWLFAVAVVCGFLAHEPLQVLVGGRGVRARRELGRGAVVWGALFGLITLVAGAAGVVVMPPAWRWTAMVPLVPALYVLLAALRRQERRTAPEVAAAVAFSLALVPLCLSAGVDAGRAWAAALVYAVTFALMTLAVRVVVLTMRGGGDPAAASAMRRTVVALASLALLAGGAASISGWWPRGAVATLVPSGVAAVGLALWPPSATQLRRVGWALVGSSCATMILLLVLLR